jgi:pimeloyl-ACP methyl ester carboxylesterase
MGGFVVEQNLINHPERILTATIIGAGPTSTPSVSKELNLSERNHEAIKILFSAKPSGLYYNDRDSWKQKWQPLNGDYPVDMQLMDEYTSRFYQLTQKKTNTKNHIALFSTMSPTIAYDLKEVEVPTLILHGTLDNLVPFDHGRALSGLIPHSKFVPLEGAGHMFFDERLWNQIAKEILNFIP